VSRDREPYPTSKQFVELDRVRQQPASKERTSQAWRLIGQAYGNDDLAVLLDRAMEHGLISSCEDAWQSARQSRGGHYFVWVNPADGSEMVWIPAGRFFVGPKERKETAESKGFSLARHPVTNRQFAKFLKETAYTPPAEHPDPEAFLSHWSKGTIPKKSEDHPVVWVSYLDALAYCDWAGLTLPTEWLWEKAARGLDGPPFPWGDRAPILPYGSKEPRLANVRSTSICAVGSFPRTRTAYGCEDMVGNVSEWCQMIEGKDHGQFPAHRPEIEVPKSRTPVYTAVRGSCFLRSGRDGMSAWHRRRLSVTRRNRWVGFRPACLVPYYPCG
jgi:serine/threonine-protein kinase